MTDKLKESKSASWKPKNRRFHSEETKKKISQSRLGMQNHKTHGISCDYPELFGLWESMKARCENPNRERYPSYGGRGISVCKEWHDVSVFAKWAFENGYQLGLQIDRIDNDGNYEPGNCRWVTPKQNSRNRRNTKHLTVNGITKCVAEWCEMYPISQYTMYDWYRKKGREYAEGRMKEVIKNAR